MRASAIGIAAALAAAQLSAQQPAPSFRAGIDVLTVEASVTDGNGAPVTGLGEADFTVTINGQPRRVRTARFRHYEGSDEVTSAPAPAIPAPVSNTVSPGRIVVFVVDRESIAPGSEKVLFESASILVDGLGPTDAAGVLELPGAVTDLTRDHGRVRKALGRVAGSRPLLSGARDYNITFDEAIAYDQRDALTIERVVERECPNVKQPSATGGGTAETLRNPCPPALELLAREILQTGRMRSQTVLASLYDLAKQLTPMKGTKQIVFLSSGIPWMQEMQAQYDRFTRQAAAAQILFYGIHVDQPGADVAARRIISSPYGGREYTTGMANLASETGGSFVMASGSGAGIFERMRSALNNFYELGVEFEPRDLSLDSFTIDVKVTRPGATVRYRRRVAPPAAFAGADRLADMLKQPTDLGELPMAVSAYTMRGDEASTLRTLVGLEAGTAIDRGPADWGFSVFTDGNLVATGRQRLNGANGPWSAALSAKLVPGRYRLRTALVDAAGRAGVLERDLEVGLRGNATAQFSDLLTGVADVNGRMQPSSRIPKGAPLSLLMEVVSADPAALEQVKTVLEIVPGGTATPIKKLVMGARSGTSAAILNNQAEIPTADLPAGRYTAIATPMLGEQALGRVARIFEIVESRGTPFVGGA